MPDTPSSEPQRPTESASAHAATSSTPSTEPDAARHAAATDVLLPDEQEMAPPHGLAAARLDSESGEPGIPPVLDGGRAGSYTVERRLGKGGMGEVYLARQAGARGF